MHTWGLHNAIVLQFIHKTSAPAVHTAVAPHHTGTQHSQALVTLQNIMMHLDRHIGQTCRPAAGFRPFAAAQQPRQGRMRTVTAAAGASNAVPAPNAACKSPEKLASDSSRRTVLLAGVSGLVATALATTSGPALALQQSPEVGTYLPPAGIDDLVQFVPDSKKTPAIRAATVNPNSPYRFALPPTWREAKVANIQSGNYCQPRCAEPWTEVIFDNPQEGKLQVIVSPLVRLTNKAGATIEDIGSPSGILTSLGSFITGTYLDEEDVVSATSKKQDDGLTYYYYEINALAATNGPHSLSACTTKGDLALLMVVSANDKQWARSQAKLRKVLESFRA